MHYDRDAARIFTKKRPYLQVFSRTSSSTRKNHGVADFVSRITLKLSDFMITKCLTQQILLHKVV